MTAENKTRITKFLVKGKKKIRNHRIRILSCQRKEKTQPVAIQGVTAPEKRKKFILSSAFLGCCFFVTGSGDIE